MAGRDAAGRRAGGVLHFLQADLTGVVEHFLLAGPGPAAGGEGSDDGQEDDLFHGCVFFQLLNSPALGRD